MGPVGPDAPEVPPGPVGPLHAAEMANAQSSRYEAARLAGETSIGRAISTALPAGDLCKSTGSEAG